MAKNEWTMEGIPELIKKVGELTRAKRKGLRVGLIRMGLMVQRESQKRVPLDTGALKNSAFTRDITGQKSIDVKISETGKSAKPTEAVTVIGDGNDKPQVIVGYTQNYAIFVHERLELRHPIGQAKFLSSVLSDKAKEGVAIVTASLLEHGG